MKTLLILLLVTYQLLATEYNSLLLRAQATIFPKIMLLDKEISQKTSDGAVTLDIVYNTREKEQAENFKALIEQEYEGMLGSYKLNVRAVDINEKEQLNSATAYYFFDLQDDSKKELLAKATKSKKICFVYDYKDFKEHALISLIIKEKTYIYLNKASIKEYDIKFIPIFYKIVKAK